MGVTPVQMNMMSNLGWGDGYDYNRSPHKSAKFARESPVLSDEIIDMLYGTIEPHEAVSVATNIETATRQNDDASPRHLKNLAGLAQWLRYWGNRGVEISGGP